ncbi:hypothetical protein CSUI_006789, partial [Cystoisospora suis]
MPFKDLTGFRESLYGCERTTLQRFPLEERSPKLCGIARYWQAAEQACNFFEATGVSRDVNLIGLNHAKPASPDRGSDPGGIRNFG